MTQSTTLASKMGAGKAGAAKRHAPWLGRTTAAVVLGVVGIGLSGCGLSSLTSGLGSSVFGSEPSADATGGKVNEEQLLSAAKSGETVAAATGAIEQAPGCPKVAVWPRDNNLTIYEPGRVGDGLAIMHRGEITKTARECQIESGRVTVKYGFSGRILLGPRGKSGPVQLPVTIYVTDAKREKIASDSMKVDTTVAVENPIGYFSAVRTVTIPVPEGARPGEYEVFVGFDRNTPNAG